MLRLRSKRGRDHFVRGASHKVGLEAKGKHKGDRIYRPALRVPRPGRDREARRDVSMMPARHASRFVGI